MAEDDQLSRCLRDSLELLYKLRDHAAIAREWHEWILRLSTRIATVYRDLGRMADEWSREARLIGHCPECGAQLEICANQLREKLGEMKHAHTPDDAD